MGRARRGLALACGALLVASCGGGDTVPAPTTSATAPASPTTAATSSFALFDQATVIVGEGTDTRRLPVWLAATDEQRRRGLMEVTDPGLEGRAGMAFWFGRVTEGGFWMRNTRLPLTIVFVNDEGGVRTIADMVPCPDSEPECPVTRPTGTYRWALEVPTERWDDLGLAATSVLRLEAPGLSATGSS
jgi:uncharacterized membrane protein (UPF0127 family)